MPPVTMLRVCLLQNWYALSDPMAEEALHDSDAMRRFAGIVARLDPEVRNPALGAAKAIVQTFLSVHGAKICETECLPLSSFFRISVPVQRCSRMSFVAIRWYRPFPILHIHISRPTGG